MKLTTILCALLLPAIAFSQAKPITSTDVLNAFDKPLWQTHFNSPLISYEAGNIDGLEYLQGMGCYNDSLITVMSYQISPGKNLTGFNYVNRYTGKKVHSYSLPTGQYSFVNEPLRVAYYTSNDTLYQFNTTTFVNKALAITPGYKLYYSSIMDSIIYLGSTSVADTSKHPIFIVNDNTQHVTRHNVNIRGYFASFHGKVVVWWDNNFVFYGTDTTTSQVLWKLDMSFQNMPAHNTDSTIYNCIYQRFSLNDTLHYIRNVYFKKNYRLNKEYAITMDINTGKIIKQVLLPQASPQKKLPNAAVVTTDTARKHFYLTHTDQNHNWTFDLTPYYAHHQFHDLVESGTYKEPVSASDSKKLYVYLYSYLWCFDVESGQPLWHKHITGVSNIETTVFRGNFLLMFDHNNNHVIAINRNNNNDIASRKLSYNFAMVANADIHSIYLADKNNTLKKVELPQ